MSNFVFCIKENEWFRLHKNQIYEYLDEPIGSEWYKIIIRPDVDVQRLAIKKVNYDKLFITMQEYRKIKLQKIIKINEGTM